MAKRPPRPKSAEDSKVKEVPTVDGHIDKKDIKEKEAIKFMHLYIEFIKLEISWDSGQWPTYWLPRKLL